jgi:tetratricopeptide (TPR) repeat protein
MYNAAAFMSGTQPSGATHRPVTPDLDRDAKIERLLVAGLDHYFAGHYDEAINVWSRALFFDHGYSRARAYIERAQSALAERQRESEEMLQKGVAAFQRGDGREARRLLTAALDRGVHPEEALAVLSRLDRLELGATAAQPLPLGRATVNL